MVRARSRCRSSHVSSTRSPFSPASGRGLRDSTMTGASIAPADRAQLPGAAPQGAHLGVERADRLARKREPLGHGPQVLGQGARHQPVVRDDETPPRSAPSGPAPPPTPAAGTGPRGRHRREPVPPPSGAHRGSRTSGSRDRRRSGPPARTEAESARARAACRALPRFAVHREARVPVRSIRSPPGRSCTRGQTGRLQAEPGPSRGRCRRAPDSNTTEGDSTPVQWM